MNQIFTHTCFIIVLFKTSEKRKMEKTQALNEKIIAAEHKENLVLNSELESKIAQNEEND